MKKKKFLKSKAGKRVMPALRVLFSLLFLGMLAGLILIARPIGIARMERVRLHETKVLFRSVLPVFEKAGYKSAP